MRVALFVLALLAAGCTCGERIQFDEYPGENVTEDLRRGIYTANTGYTEVLAFVQPRVVTVPGIPDQPVVAKPLAVAPVRPGVTPLPPARLASLLPAPPAGWMAEEASATNVITPHGELTEASRAYWKGAVTRSGATPDGASDHASVLITLLDRAQTGPSIVMPSDEGADERRAVTTTAVEVSGVKGTHFAAGPEFRQIDLDINGRFLLRVRGGHLSAEELQAWAALVPVSDLAGM